MSDRQDTDLAASPGRPRVVGIRQTIKAIRAGRVERLLVAVDAAEPLIREVLEAAAAAEVPVQRTQGLAELGRSSGIAVGAMAVGILRETGPSTAPDPGQQ